MNEQLTEDGKTEQEETYGQMSIAALAGAVALIVFIVGCVLIAGAVR